jgi:hypothetical protein
MGRFKESDSNAVSQFLGRGLCEGHYKNFRWHQGTAKSTKIAMSKDQSHIKRRNGVGFAGPGTGLNQAAPRQGKAQGI